jgi:hypothetical protein
VSDDKPAHMITIPDSLGRDVDAFYAGKREAPPIEAFMSEESIQQVVDSTVAAGTVHAEDLVPITAAEAARRTTFDGDSLPKMPSTRRVIPPPFQRPSFNLDRHGRAWSTCRADEVAVDDVVVDFGRVARKETVLRYETIAGIPDVAVGMKVILTGVTGNQAAFEPGHNVRAFRLAELWRPGRAGAGWTSAAGWASPPTATSRPGPR